VKAIVDDSDKKGQPQKHFKKLSKDQLFSLGHTFLHLLVGRNSYYPYDYQEVIDWLTNSEMLYKFCESIDDFSPLFHPRLSNYTTVRNLNRELAKIESTSLASSKKSERAFHLVMWFTTFRLLVWKKENRMTAKQLLKIINKLNLSARFDFDVDKNIKTRSNEMVKQDS